MDWVCLLLDAHFTVLVMTPEAKGLLRSLHSFVKSQVTTGQKLSCAPWLDEEHRKVCWIHPILSGIERRVPLSLRWDWCQSWERSRAASMSSTRWRRRRTSDSTPSKSLSCFRMWTMCILLINNWRYCLLSSFYISWNKILYICPKC